MLMSVFSVGNNGLHMEVALEKHKSDKAFGDLSYKVYIELFFNDSKVDIVNVPTDLLSNLLEKVRYKYKIQIHRTNGQKKGNIF